MRKITFIFLLVFKRIKTHNFSLQAGFNKKRNLSETLITLLLNNVVLTDEHINADNKNIQ